MAKKVSTADAFFGRRHDVLSAQEKINRRVLPQWSIQNLRTKAA